MVVARAVLVFGHVLDFHLPARFVLLFCGTPLPSKSLIAARIVFPIKTMSSQKLLIGCAQRPQRQGLLEGAQARMEGLGGIIITRTAYRALKLEFKSVSVFCVFCASFSFASCRQKKTVLTSSNNGKWAGSQERKCKRSVLVTASRRVF